MASLLPPLRQELALFPAPPDQADGSPCWHLQDPPNNKYYKISWQAFEILSRWKLGTIEAIVQDVQQKTTLTIDQNTILNLIQFLSQNHLLDAKTNRDTQQLNKAYTDSKKHWLIWLVKNYLFFRVPLVKPNNWLQRHQQLGRFILQPWYWYLMIILAVSGLFMVSKQWEQFIHGFSAYTGWQTLLAFGTTLILTKIMHELGHAFIAKYHGCKVPTMGIAFLVMWPVLYTDTNDSWKLARNKQRIQIGIAGMAVEMSIAIFATWAWLLLPDGPLRAACFFIATTSWIMTLALNSSPFMRFDGYFVLSDYLNMPNLHSRSFAMGRWWLRERLFALNDPQPEQVSHKRKHFMIWFAYATWLYRFILFLSIALLVYHFFFKLLGIILMLIEVTYFILFPITREIKTWWKKRKQMQLNTTTTMSIILFTLLLMLLIVPWKTRIAAPAILLPAQAQTLYTPVAAQIIETVKPITNTINQGDILLTLYSPELEHQLTQATIKQQQLALTDLSTSMGIFFSIFA
ncbi:MAG: peptidase M50 [Candidatus Electrothrix sp. AS4_5]|nr:peptidase M50 [Candidatus Electrothrix gigas]